MKFAKEKCLRLVEKMGTKTRNVKEMQSILTQNLAMSNHRSLGAIVKYINTIAGEEIISTTSKRGGHGNGTYLLMVSVEEAKNRIETYFLHLEETKKVETEVVNKAEVAPTPAVAKADTNTKTTTPTIPTIVWQGCTSLERKKEIVDFCCRELKQYPKGLQPKDLSDRYSRWAGCRLVGLNAEDICKMSGARIKFENHNLILSICEEEKKGFLDEPINKDLADAFAALASYLRGVKGIPIEDILALRKVSLNTVLDTVISCEEARQIEEVRKKFKKLK